MKKALLLLSAIFIVSDCFAFETLLYRINGSFTGSVKSKYVYLRIGSNAFQSTQITGSPVKDGLFTITGTVKFPAGDICDAMLFLSDRPGLQIKDIPAELKKYNYDARHLILVKEVSVSIPAVVGEAIVTGGQINEINNRFQAINVHEKKQYDSIRKWYQSEMTAVSSDKAAMQKTSAEWSQKMLMIQTENALKRIKVIELHPDSKISLHQFTALAFLNKYSAGKFQAPLEEAWQKIPDSLKNNKEAKNARQQLINTAQEMVLKDGDKIPDYKFISDRGELISLESFRGKYLLLDFWTSWCGPCRAEHYYTKKAYEKYQNKKFTILQVSLDNKKEKWLKALEEDNLPWQNILNSTGWDESFAKIFGFKSIPANFLIDPNGYIIARNLRGEELEKKLEETLKEQND